MGASLMLLALIARASQRITDQAIAEIQSRAPQTQVVVVPDAVVPYRDARYVQTYFSKWPGRPDLYFPGDGAKRCSSHAMERCMIQAYRVFFHAS